MEREQRNKEWVAQRDLNRRHNRKIFQRFNGDPLYSPDRGKSAEEKPKEEPFVYRSIADREQIYP